jgi:hypothetical protein
LDIDIDNMCDPQNKVGKNLLEDDFRAAPRIQPAQGHMVFGDISIQQNKQNKNKQTNYIPSFSLG